jgi:hypothetical protein
LAVGLAHGRLRGLERVWGIPVARAPAATPRGTFRRTQLACLTSGLVGGLAVAVSSCCAVGITLVDSVGTTMALAAGPVVGLLLGAPAGFFYGQKKAQVRLVRLAEQMLLLTGKGRGTLLNALEDAHRRQVLRQAGAVFQFRHAELQDQLARTHRSPRVDRRGSARP